MNRGYVNTNVVRRLKLGEVESAMISALIIIQLTEVLFFPLPIKGHGVDCFRVSVPRVLRVFDPPTISRVRNPKLSCKSTAR